MKKTLAFVFSALMALGASLTGCAVDADSEDELRTSTQAYQQGMSCDTNNGINPMKAALAVAMSTELGRIDPVRDLVDLGWGVVLSEDAWNTCASRGYPGCPNTDGILGMQYWWVNWSIPSNIFNATTFHEELTASFDRQRTHEQNLARNQPWMLPSDHELHQIGTNDYGACGIHYDFAASGNNVANLKERMMFFGGDANPFIDFRSSDGMISIDPSGTMNGDSDANSGMCSVGCYGYGTHLRNKCCSCGGQQGTFLPAPWNPRMVYCAY